MAKRKRKKKSKSRQRPQNPVYSAGRDVPTHDYFEGIDLPDDIDEILDNLIYSINQGDFLLWEGVMCREQGLPLTRKQKRALSELINFNDEDDRILYINEFPRPSEPWYETVRKVAPYILQEGPLRTIDGGSWVLFEIWPKLVEALEEHGRHLSLPEGVESPLGIFPPDLLHKLWLQECFDALMGLGQDEELTLANEDQREYRIKWMIDCLQEHKDTVQYFDLTLESLLTRITIVPPKDKELFIEIMTKELGLTSPQDPLVDFLE